MSKNGFAFNKQKDKAEADEREAVNLLRKYGTFKNLEHQADADAVADAYDPVNKSWLEIKVDYHISPNHFVERFSIKESQAPGGPWQYAARGVEFYAFYYKRTGGIYVFRTVELMQRTEALLNSGIVSDSSHGKSIPQQERHKGDTYGYAISKELYEDICFFSLPENQKIPGYDEDKI